MTASRKALATIALVVLALVAVVFGSVAVFAASNVEKPVYGGVFRVAQNEPSNLNPITSADGPSHFVWGRIYEGLLSWNPAHTEIEPVLATSWEQPNATTYIFHLRKNVKWQDGSAFTSADVKFTFETMLDPKSKAVRRQNFAGISRIETPDSYTVKFILNSPNAFFIQDIATIAPIISKKHTEKVGLDKLSQNPMGTGAFKLKSWAPGEKVVLEANKSYWGGRPYLDQIEYKVIPDLNTQVAALLAGEVDYIAGSLDVVDQVKDDPNIKVYNVPWVSVIWHQLGFNLRQERFQDVRVRKAFYYAIDRSMINKAVFRGYTYVPDSPVPKAHTGYYVAQPDAKYEYNPTKAKQLLAEAGWKDHDGDGILDKNGEPFKFTTMVSTADNAVIQTSQIIQAQLAQIGIKMDIATYEIGTWIAKANAGEFDAEMITLGVGFTPALQEQYFHSKGGFNFWKYNNPKVDKLFESGKAEVNEAKRKQIYAEYQRLFMQEVPMVLLTNNPFLVFLNKKVHGMENTNLEGAWMHRVWIER